MKLIETIPIGKKYKKTRQELMSEAKITDMRNFKQEMAKLRHQYIIISDNGYYLPATKDEYLEFVNKQVEKMNEITELIELANKEMEELENVRSIHNNIEKC